MALNIDGTTGIVYDNLASDVRNLFLPKNWIINGMFDVWQRGTSQTTSGYGSDDRFANMHDISTKTHSRQAFTVGQTDVPNNPTYFSRTIVSSGNTSNSTVWKGQKIEDVRKLAGKTVTISFWAKADSNKNMSIFVLQNFGMGGSVDVAVIVEKFALTSTWKKFSKTILIPNISGKTIGANSFLHLHMFFDAGSGYNTFTDSLGNQSGTFDIANVSLVEGSVAVECQNQPYADVLEQCRDYYREITGQYTYLQLATLVGATDCTFSIRLDKPMRAIPVVSLVGIRGTDYVIRSSSAISNSTGTLTINVQTNEHFQLSYNTGTFTENTLYHFVFLTTTCKITISAEL